MLSILPARRALLFATAFFALLLITGCGLKGDLVLPESDVRAASQQQENKEDGEQKENRSPDGRSE